MNEEIIQTGCYDCKGKGCRFCNWTGLVTWKREKDHPICNDEPVSDAHHLIGRTFWRRKCFWIKKNGLGVGRKCR